MSAPLIGECRRYSVTGQYVTVRAYDSDASARMGESVFSCADRRGNLKRYRARLLQPVTA